MEVGSKEAVVEAVKDAVEAQVSGCRGELVRGHRRGWGSRMYMELT